MAEMDGRIRPRAKRCLCTAPLPGGSPVPKVPGSQAPAGDRDRGQNCLKRLKMWWEQRTAAAQHFRRACRRWGAV